MDASSNRFKVLNTAQGATPQKKYKRKIAAIMSADVKDYSKLMGRSDELTVSTITEYRKVFFNKVFEHSGAIVDSPGDNILSEFGSAVDAVKCAIEVQAEIKERNLKLDKKHKMKFRIGINLGDVIEDQGRLYGDGVNIAARLESLAIGGGVCISGTLYDHVKDKMRLDVAYLGGQSVKNIKNPVRTYKLIMNKNEVFLKREYRAILYFVGSTISAYLLYLLHLRFLIAENNIMSFLVLNPVLLIKSYLILAIPPFLVGIGFIIYVLNKKGLDSRLLKILRAFCYGSISTILVIILGVQIPAGSTYGFQESLYKPDHSFIKVNAESVNILSQRDVNSEPIHVLSSGNLLMLSDTEQSTLNQWNNVIIDDRRSAWINRNSADGNDAISIKAYSFKYLDFGAFFVGLVIALLFYRRKIL